MSVKIYHGPPGSYKSASAVMNEVMRCAREGRLLITNVRGLTEERVRKNARAFFGFRPAALHPDFKVISLRRDLPEDMDRMRKWWHWAPEGAYIILDEVQSVYPPKWSASELRTLDMLEPRTMSNGETLAREVELVFDMHRHGNWDLAFTTPSIKKVRSEIRAASEFAYKHKNLGVLGIPGLYVQGSHSADDNGNASELYTTVVRRIPGWVFKLYDSTATGKTQDTTAGTSLWKEPKFALVAAVVALCVWWLIRSPTPSIFGRDAAAHSAAHSVAGASAAVGAPSSGSAPGFVRPAAAPPATGDSGVMYSGVWRLVGIVSGAARYALISDWERERRVSLSSCKRDFLREWSCLVDGELVTQWTGSSAPDPVPQPLAVAAPPS